MQFGIPTVKSAVPHSESPTEGLWHRIRRQLVTADMIYGTILVSAILVIADEDEDDLSLLSVVAVTSIVFWIAHVFAATVAQHGKRNGKTIPLPVALREAITHSSGLLFAAVFPVVTLGLGVIGVLTEDAAYVVSLVGGVAILFALGAIAFALRGSRWYFCLVAALLTALLGVVVILMKAVLH
ncbi:hypothetical protein N1027_05350 [Herbiconiux sp. CPCC 205763]|uniref:Integral membrane protein n=1 Tax=Herbiconiux aconitum TaxID=2970913 RepID=A0ABT2GMV3_9MICO|nr:hypothetical protein [Herbiconiux aconitum]MCS5717560.1 hypothetical protein [Herbiconiux aconitum]